MMPQDPESVEKQVLDAVDAAFAEARVRAGEWLACRPGCDECCHRPFAITAADARRLQAGLADLPSETQTEIRERAHQARLRMADDFPGDSGVLTDHPEWREWFFARHTGVPCPVLDLETGGCRLYSHRPVACRLAGPLIQIGASQTDPCHLCFQGVPAFEITSTKVVINLPYFNQEALGDEQVIAFIL